MAIGGYARRLVSFQIRDCFGFRDSTRVNLEDASNLIYLLGKNSSGKSSFLAALHNMSWGMVPLNHAKFANFNGSKEQGELIAQYALGTDGLRLGYYLTDFIEKVGKHPGIHANVRADAFYDKALKEIATKLEEAHRPLFDQATAAGTMWVRKNSSGNYQFSADGDFNKDWQDQQALRERAVERALSETFRDRQIVVGGQGYPINITPEQVQNAIFMRFPTVALVDRRQGLTDDLLDRITEQDAISGGPNEITTAFVWTLLGRDTVLQFLRRDNPLEVAQLMQEMQAKVDEVTEEVDRWRDAHESASDDLLRIILSAQRDGLQITVRTGTKLSFYRHISDNTKLLFAYFLFRRVGRLRDDILLFDEPNEGLHATAQEHRLNFLQQLGKVGKLVVVSTHSEYLIDPSHLTGVRLMGVDKTDEMRQMLIVSNHYHAPLDDAADYLALRPVTDAIGLKYGSSKLHIQDRVIATEGVTDMIYLRAFNEIFGFTDQLFIAPARGDGTILHVIALLISQDLRFKFVVDSATRNTIRSRIQKGYPIGDQYIKEVPIPPTSSQGKGSGIEDLLSKANFRKLIEDMGWKVEPDFDSMSNNEYMNPRRAPKPPAKRILAEWFSQQMHAGKYMASDFDGETTGHFRAVLDFCYSGDWFRM